MCMNVKNFCNNEWSFPTAKVGFNNCHKIKRPFGDDLAFFGFQLWPQFCSPNNDKLIIEHLMKK